jgi:hypothetical protein
MSYARPQNMQRIVDDVLASGACKQLVLTNNNPDIDIRHHVTVKSDIVQILQQTRRTRPVIRQFIARESGDEYFVAIDDDIFLTPAQIRALVDALYGDPSVPHGVWGEILRLEKDGVWVKKAIHNVDREVTVLNRVYAFTRAHILRFFEILRELKIPPEALGMGDDLVLSHTGATPPKCHDLGPIEDCPTANQKGIAIWQEDDFYPYRALLLRAVKPLFKGGDVALPEETR